MSSKLAFSIAAALALFAGVARAEPARGAAASDSEAGIPDSIANRSRTFSGHSPSNAEINAFEACNPESVDYRDRMPVSSRPISDADWRALESGNPEIY